MDRVVWKGTLRPGKLAEYRRRHDELWPELRALFRRAGIRNYTIWNRGDELFGYYECDNRSAADAVKATDPVMARWTASMAGLMELEQPADGEGFRQVFSLDDACALPPEAPTIQPAPQRPNVNRTQKEETV